METVTYSKVQELLKKLPAAKLPIAYNMLIDLVNTETNIKSSRSNFMFLPLDERRKILGQQANEMIEHYQQTTSERQTWQAGDFADEY